MVTGSRSHWRFNCHVFVGCHLVFMEEYVGKAEK